MKSASHSKAKKAKRHVAFLLPDGETVEAGAGLDSEIGSEAGSRSKSPVEFGEAWPLPKTETAQSLPERAVHRLVQHTNDLFAKEQSQPLSMSDELTKYRVQLRLCELSASAIEAANKIQVAAKPRKKRAFAESALSEEKAPSADELERSIAARKGESELVESAAAAAASEEALKVVAKTGSLSVAAMQVPKRTVAADSSHVPWSLYKVIAGHTSWVQCVAFDASNDWFVTGAGDRTIKVWEFPTGKLRLTLTGHVSGVRGLCVSTRHPYLFSCGEDKKVLCWDLEQNKVIRSYHGHLSGVYCVALHPTLDVLLSGGRDSSCRVWDARTKEQVMLLSGHKSTVHCVAAQSSEPQVITGSHDRTVRCWDLKKGSTQTTLTHHKKAVRALAIHPKEYTFASAAADNIKVWRCPEASFVRNMSEPPQSIVECMAVNGRVLASGTQSGHLNFYDWHTGKLFETQLQPPQPGSLDCEAGIAACAFDNTGSRLVTCEYDKTIKMWKEDLSAAVAARQSHTGTRSQDAKLSIGLR